MARKNRGKQSASEPVESQASVFLTVAWALTVMTTLLCAGLAAVAWLVFRNRPDTQSALAFVQLLHFCSVVTGFVSMFMLPVVLKVRRVPPPPGFMVFAIVVAALPILAVLL